MVAYGQTWGSGLVINSFGDYQPVVLKNITATNNYLHGIAMTSCGKTDLINVMSLKNGSQANEGHGLTIFNDFSSLITIRNSFFSYNSGNGIELKVANPYDTSLFKLYNVSYLGNDSNLNGSMDIEHFFS